MGNWTLGPEIGRGPTGVTFLATSFVDGSTAAVKVLHANIVDAASLPKLPGEFLALRRLTHPNLASILEAGVYAGQGYVVREWVEGIDLATLLKSHHSTDTWRQLAISMAVQIGWALHHGHRRSLLHRRLSPSNVIVSSDGKKVTLTDFGLAKIVPVPPLSLSSETWSSLAFQPPELFTGKPSTKRSDLYSLGAVVYAAVSGRPPFSATTAAEFMHKHCYLLPDRPINIVPKTPIDLDDLICSLLAKDPARRPQSALAVLDDLDKLRGRLERKKISVLWPADPGDTNQHSPLSSDQLTMSEAESPSVSSRPIFARMTVVGPSLAFVVVILLYLLLRPGPTAQEYFDGAQRLLATGKPDDAERAWDDYLEPLTRKYPGQFTDEISVLRAGRSLGRDLIRAIEQGVKARYGSEAERLYARGIALARVGAFAEAKECWEQAATTTDASEQWIAASKRAINEMSKRGQ